MNNSIKIFFVLALTLGVASCSPKVGVLRAPGHTNTTVNTTANNSDAETTANAHTTKGSKFNQRNIALLLPFQLHQIEAKTVNNSDVKRAALALDFYQGFELGLKELSKKNGSYDLHVLDTRDNVKVVSTLAMSKDLANASLVVGPIYPQEIKSFGDSFLDKEVLQINPLSASMPTEFNLPNLVSITPPIKAHSNAIANRVAKDFKTGDIIIIFNTNDSDSRQFLNGMSAAIKHAKATATVVSVASIAQLNENLSLDGANYIISGTTDKVQLKSLVDNLTSKYLENYYGINLFGHPLWDRYDFSMYEDFSNLNPVITTESNLKTWSTAVKSFKDTYVASFGVNPSDASYKGYDSAIYFGGLIGKYGAGNISDKLVKDSFNGIYSSYKFMHNTDYGYVNESVFFKIYRGDGFQLQ